MGEVPDADAVLHATEAGRRAGWASYFNAREERDSARRNTVRAIENTVVLAILAVRNPRLAHNDPLVLLSQDILNDIGSSRAGVAMIARLQVAADGFY